MGKTSESINALISLLDFSPTDAEAWAELSDLYISQGLYSQATYALEEALVLQPNAWNVSCYVQLEIRSAHLIRYRCTPGSVRCF